MGLDVHALRFLNSVASEKSFKRTITLGRQNTHCNISVLKKMGWRQDYVPNFVEEVFESLFGSESKVESVDNADYEGASIIHDMNERLPSSIPDFDTVVDLGTLEHIFNVRQSIENVINLARVGGSIVHVLPANNFGGHGFYQFSPELFFTVYSEINGFKDTQVFFKTINSSNAYYKVSPPKDGKRVLFNSLYPCYILVVTKKIRKVDSLTIQQSDYVSLWADDNLEANAPKFPDKYAEEPLWDRWPLRYAYRPYFLLKNSLSILNPALKKVKFD